MPVNTGASGVLEKGVWSRGERVSLRSLLGKKRGLNHLEGGVGVFQEPTFGTIFIRNFYKEARSGFLIMS